MSVRQTSAAVFWRDLHAVTGAIVGTLIFFLAITGLPVGSGAKSTSLCRSASGSLTGAPSARCRNRRAAHMGLRRRPMVAREGTDAAERRCFR